MMKYAAAECTDALGMIFKSIDMNARFPSNILIGSWSTFFFDADRIFSPEFVTIVSRLLILESGRCACILNIDRKSLDGSRSVACIDASITPDDYLEFLRSDSMGGWLYDMGRFSCSSDKNQWIIYCERDSEIAVLGIRDDVDKNKFTESISSLKGLRIDEAIQQHLSFGFSLALSPEWTRELLRAYG